MKKLFFLAAPLLLLCSCDFIMKDRSSRESEVVPEKKIVLGPDKDAQGCVASAGYRWSDINKECVRVFEEGYRLNSIQQLKETDDVRSAFVIFEENGKRAELFLPDGSKSIMLTREKETGPFKNGSWSLQSDKAYTLTKSGLVLYAGAVIEEQQITGDDKPEDV